MAPRYKTEALLWLAVAAGHLDAARRMIDHGACCVALRQQLAVAQVALEQVQRLMLSDHLSACVAAAVIRHRMDDELIDHLMDALTYTKSLTDGRSYGPSSCSAAGTTRILSLCSGTPQPGFRVEDQTGHAGSS